MRIGIEIGIATFRNIEGGSIIIDKKPWILENGTWSFTGIWYNTGLWNYKK